MSVQKALDDAESNVYEDGDPQGLRMCFHHVWRNICRALMRGDSVPVLAELLPLHGVGRAADVGSGRHHAVSAVARSHEGKD